MGVGNPEQVRADRLAHLGEDLRGEAFVLLWRAHVLSTVAGDDVAGRARLIRHEGGVDRDEAAAGPERSRGATKEQLRLIVVEVVQYAEGKHEVEVSQVRGELRRVAHSEVGAVAVGLARLFDVFPARVDADVLHVAEISRELAGPAAEIEDARAFPRVNVGLHEPRTRAIASDDSGEEHVDPGPGEDTVEIGHGAAR